MVTGDLRALSPEQLAKAKQTMLEIVAQHLPKTTATITFDDGYPPMAPTDGNSACSRCTIARAATSAAGRCRRGRSVARRRRRRVVRRQASSRW